MIKPADLIAKTMVLSENYRIDQFEYKGLAHFSYAILAGNRIIIIDPQRNPQIYFDYAENNNASIVGVVETHPHADFVSAHLEMHEKLNVPIYASSFTEAKYPVTLVEDGTPIKLTKNVGLRVLDTPGHSPDHISVVLFENTKDVAVFSGDSLLIGDVGRPDLRDFSGDFESQRQQLAEKMYDTIHGKFANLSDDVTLYPAHGAGSLCGKFMRKASSSTIGYEKLHNHAFQKMKKEKFVDLLLNDQPFVPHYFQYDVGINLKGAPPFTKSVANVPQLEKNYQPPENAKVIDSRKSSDFKTSYLHSAINIQGGGSFETWLGTVVEPKSDFYLVAANEEELKEVIVKAAAIGYESKIRGAFIYDSTEGEKFTTFDENTFVPEENNYTFVDVRMPKEVEDTPVFSNNINIPLQDLTDRISEIPRDKPILVNCASGYRSAIASSIVKKLLPDSEVYDLGAAVSKYKGSNDNKD